MRLIALVCVFCLVLPTFAQDDPPPCDIDLQDAAAALIRAQAQASSGDGAAALATIADVQAALNAIQSNCAGITPAAEATDEPEPEVTDDSPFPTQVYTANDNAYSFLMPADWIYSTREGTVFAGTTEAAANVLTVVNGSLPPGQQGATISIGTMDEIAPILDTSGGVREIVTAYQNAFFNDFNFNVEQATAYTIPGDREALGFRFSALDYEGLLLAFRLDASNLGLVLVLSAPGEGDALEELATFIAGSVGPPR